jgi:hypothetical protein
VVVQLAYGLRSAAPAEGPAPEGPVPEGPSEIIEAARQELEYPADETNEG